MLATRKGAEAYQEAERQKREGRVARELERARLVNEQRAVIDETRLASTVQRSLRWEKEREDRLRRERKEEALRRQLAWAAVVMCVARTTRMGQVLVATRARRVELKEKISSAKTLAVCWKMYILRKRLKALLKARMLMRPLVFWWRFNHRIRKKRQATKVLLEYLTARSKVAAFATHAKKYVLAVRKVQQAWKEAWRILKMQLDICSMWWVYADEKRGLSHTAAVHTEQRERAERRIILRNDLRERKAAHMVKLIQWKKERKEYDNWVLEQQTYLEAKRMLQQGQAPAEEPAGKGGSAADEAGSTGADEAGAAATSGAGRGPRRRYGRQQQAVEEEAAKRPKKPLERKPPPRPIFTLFGPLGHFRLLQDKMEKKREVDKRRAEREWAKQDSLRMQGELEEEMATAGPAALKRQGTKSAHTLPVPVA